MSVPRYCETDWNRRCGARTQSNGDINTNGHVHGYSNRYIYAYGDSNLYADGYCHVHADTYRYGNIHVDTYTDADLRPCRVATGSAPASGTLCDPGCARYRQ